VDKQFVIECIIKLLASFVCGFVLGIERKFRQQVVGMRTLILISVSSTLLSILSIYMAKLAGAPTGDPTRIAAGVVSGIGFLGGGAILRQGLNIKGLTSAAIIWTASALGLAIGAGLYIQSAVALVLLVLSLVFLEKVEEKWFPAEQSKMIHLVYEDDSPDLNKVKSILEASGLVVKDLNISKVMSQKQTILHYSVKAPRAANLMLLAEKLKEVAALSEFSITD
jgi:putative Mg2+ transporter-C (MgtC) family protein